MKHLLLSLALAAGLAAQSKSPLQLTVEPKAEMKADVEVPFEVTVKDAKGAAVSGAAVQVVTTMVEMDHGETKYDAKQVRPGVYRFSPKFIMGGAWNLAVKATRGADSATLNQKIDVKD
jgi:hypothetical protein